MSTVYLATDQRLERDVALKVLHPHLSADDNFLGRLGREAKAAARLSHPHVVGVLDPCCIAATQHRLFSLGIRVGVNVGLCGAQ
jgi:serine/threonine protein kinase